MLFAAMRTLDVWAKGYDQLIQLKKRTGDIVISVQSHAVPLLQPFGVFAKLATQSTAEWLTHYGDRTQHCNDKSAGTQQWL